MKNACLGAGWRRSGLSVGFSWFGERSGGMKLVGEGVGESGLLGIEEDRKGMLDERNRSDKRMMKRPKVK